MIIRTTIPAQHVDFLNEFVKPKMTGIIEFYGHKHDTEDMSGLQRLLAIDVVYVKIEECEESLMCVLADDYNKINMDFDKGIRTFVQIYWNKELE